MSTADALPAFDRRMFLATAGLAAAAIIVPRKALAQDAPAPVEVVEGAGGKEQITIQNMAFGTPEVKVKVGESVTWTNKDEGVAHNVHFRNGPMKGKPKAQGPMLNANQTYTVKFNEAGEYSYICTPHPMMKGTVIVEA